MQTIEINEYSEYVPMMFFLEETNTFNEDGKRIFKFWRNIFKEIPFQNWNLQAVGKYKCEHTDFKTVDVKDTNNRLPNVRMTYCRDCGKMEEYQEFRTDIFNFDN